MMPRTRLDRLVQIRERREDEALVHLARAQVQLASAQDRLEDAVSAAQADGRSRADAALWAADDAARRRALQLVHAAQGDVDAAARLRDQATGGWVAAHQDAEAVKRVADRKRSELLQEAARRERRAVDEIATLRFNHAK